MKLSIIAQGAEAIILKKKHHLVKDRIPKSYRIPQLDQRLRKQRTRKEIKLLEKSYPLIPVPKVISSTESTIALEEIKGKKLAICLDNVKNSKSICQQIGKSIAILHDNDIIHGDLTTSNMIISKNKVFIIDFGLGFESRRAEDKAVDLHVLKEALEARHLIKFNEFWKTILTSYKKTSKNQKETLKRLEAVEKRGRYKQSY